MLVGEAQERVDAGTVLLPGPGAGAGFPPSHTAIRTSAKQSKWIGYLIFFGILLREVLVKYYEHEILNWLHELGFIGTFVGQVMQWTWTHSMVVYLAAILTYLAIIFFSAQIAEHRQRRGKEVLSGRPWLTAQYVTES